MYSVAHWKKKTANVSTTNKYRIVRFRRLGTSLHYTTEKGGRKESLKRIFGDFLGNALLVMVYQLKQISISEKYPTRLLVT